MPRGGVGSRVCALTRACVTERVDAYNQKSGCVSLKRYGNSKEIAPVWWNWDPMEVSGTSVHTLRVNSRGEGVGAPSQPLKTWVLGAPSQPPKTCAPSQPPKTWVHTPNIKELTKMERIEPDTTVQRSILSEKLNSLGQIGVAARP